MDEESADFKLGLSLTTNLVPFIDKQGISNQAKLAASFVLITHYMDETKMTNIQALACFLGILERREEV